MSDLVLANLSWSTSISAYLNQQRSLPSVILVNHGDTESTESTIFCPIGRRRSGKPGTRPKGGTPSEARREESSPPGRVLRSTSRASVVRGLLVELPPKARGSFPWPSSPGQGKISLLCVLSASVVNSLIMTSSNCSDCSCCPLSLFLII
jgi:hypothetical protein